MRSDSYFLRRRKVGGLCFGGRDVADELKQPAIVEPVDPFERGVFDRSERSLPLYPCFSYDVVNDDNT